MVFEVLAIGHILADFYFQSEKLAEEKKKNWRKMTVHCIIYFVVVGIIIGMVTASGQWPKLVGALALVSFLHGILDCFKIKLEQKSEKVRSKRYIIFLADQIGHLGIMFGML